MTTPSAACAALWSRGVPTGWPRLRRHSGPTVKPAPSTGQLPAAPDPARQLRTQPGCWNNQVRSRPVALNPLTRPTRAQPAGGTRGHRCAARARGKLHGRQPQLASAIQARPPESAGSRNPEHRTSHAESDDPAAGPSPGGRMRPPAGHGQRQRHGSDCHPNPGHRDGRWHRRYRPRQPDSQRGPCRSHPCLRRTGPSTQPLGQPAAGTPETPGAARQGQAASADQITGPDLRDTSIRPQDAAAAQDTLSVTGSQFWLGAFLIRGCSVGDPASADGAGDGPGQYRAGAEGDD